jgi:hypothetical protein
MYTCLSPGVSQLVGALQSPSPSPSSVDTLEALPLMRTAAEAMGRHSLLH